MFTQCPHCQALFKITATELKAAEGRVRCGMCHGVFNALASLTEKAALPPPELRVDEMLPALSVQDDMPAPGIAEENFKPIFTEGLDETTDFTDQLAREIRQQESGFQEPGHDSSEEPKETMFESPDIALSIEPEPQFSSPAMDEAVMPIEQAQPVFDAQAPAESSIEGEQETASPAAFSTIENLDAEESGTLPPPVAAIKEPALMEEEETAPRRPYAGLIWSLAAIALVALLLGQGLYFLRNDLATYPQLRPVLDRLCAMTGCEIPLRRDPTLIKPLGRNVRTHPQVSQALLIESTFVNTADFHQPYPVLELSFYNLQGNLIADRRFSPQEYMPAATNFRRGVPPQEPVHVSLEIADPGKEAVSFEFNFH